jgi:hypothetical protein
MTFEQMCDIEPSLRALHDEALKIAKRQAGPRPQRFYCKTQTWYGLPRERGFIGLKFLLCQFVGFNGKIEALQTATAYDIAYRKVVDALPPCFKGRRCECRVDFAVVPLTDDQKRRIDAGTLKVLGRRPS